ncbi:hypothetical protein L6R52_05640 [Myxococcota bacterium]|nr:hypothetical protein [Myxococcota bacterium]
MPRPRMLGGMMPRARRDLAPAVAILALAAAACTTKIEGKLATGSGGNTARDAGVREDASAVAPDASVVIGADAAMPDAGTPIADAGVEEPVDAGACSRTSFAANVVLTRVEEVPTTRVLAFPLPSGGVVTAWSGGGEIAIQPLDGAGRVTRAPLVVPGDALWGLAASSDAYGVLVSRDDVLALVILGADGTMRADRTVIGGVPHDVTGNEWFGNQLRAGRLDFTGTEWVVYSTVQRLWPDGIQHYGDQLRTYAADGTPSQTLWDWGCSHSMDVRLAHNASSIGPVCSSDCFPEKGIFFWHRTTLFLDSSGNCQGYVAQELGGIAPVNDGFYVGFVSGEGRSSKDAAIIRVGNDRSTGLVRWLTETPADETAMHLGRLGSRVIASWVAGGSAYVVEIDANGAAVGTPEPLAIDAIQGASDFFTYAGGDLGWFVSGHLARLRQCP